MKIQGKFIKKLPVVSGEGQKGMWVRGGFVIETVGDYPEKIAFQTFGEERAKMGEGIMEGALVEVVFNPSSREYEGRWYTELKAMKITPMAVAAPVQPAQPVPQTESDGLPF